MNNNVIKRVAMISEHGDPLALLGGQQSGGQNVYVYELSKALSKLGVSVDVYTRWENRRSAQVVRFAKYAKVIRIKAGPRHFIVKDKFGPLMPEFVEHTLEYIRMRKIKYDVIHTHYYYSGWVGMQLKNILKIPLVHVFHSLGLIKKKALGELDTSPTDRTKIEKKIMEIADTIVSTSPQEKIDMITEYKAGDSNIKIIPAGVNLKRFCPLDKIKSRKKLKLDLEKKIVVFAGKMEKRKGASTLVRAINLIRTKQPKLFENIQVYLFTGDPRKKRKKEAKEANDRKLLSDLIKKLKLENTIALLPGIEQDCLHLYYGAANVVIMPSYYEPFGMVAVEAMATGTPVVASNVGGLKWTIEDGITGYHAEPKDANGFSAQIIKILSDSDLQDRLGQNSIIRARKNYSWPIIAKQTLNLYNKLSSRGKK